jgi:3-methyladenine DNA glycosylase AlkD
LVTGIPGTASFRAERERRFLRHALRGHADPTNGRFLASYLGSPLPVLGVRTPALRQVVRAWRTRVEHARSASVQALLKALWQGDWFEERAAAVELLTYYAKVDSVRAWSLAGHWVDSATGWALSDSLASGPVSRMVAANPARFEELLDWTRSPNFWRRRAATYALHDWVMAGALERPFRLLRRLVRDPEFWVQRAVGTWLRECWKRDRMRTERFLRRYARELSPTSITVATERAPQRFRNELRERHRAKRPASRRRP